MELAVVEVSILAFFILGVTHTKLHMIPKLAGNSEAELARNQTCTKLGAYPIPKKMHRRRHIDAAQVCPSRANSVVHKQVRFLRHRAPIQVTSIRVVKKQAISSSPPQHQLSTTAGSQSPQPWASSARAPPSRPPGSSHWLSSLRRASPSSAGRASAAGPSPAEMSGSSSPSAISTARSSA